MFQGANTFLTSLVLTAFAGEMNMLTLSLPDVESRPTECSSPSESEVGLLRGFKCFFEKKTGLLTPKGRCNFQDEGGNLAF